MNSRIIMETDVTEQNFDEDAYLLANPDVASVVQSGEFDSGRHHYLLFGKDERRRQRLPAPHLLTAKGNKMALIRPLLRKDLPCVETSQHYDYLSEELREDFNIVDTAAVSSNGYDRDVMELIDETGDGIILDCGAGRRPEYFENVVNFEIANYDTTDVRGVGEVLPFIDNSFDAVISIAVLEHVKDPFLCASEIARVLKPGGKLLCCVPFLQPLHGYPHHYYNMTNQGLDNLFSELLYIDRLQVVDSILPIWSLTWILGSWANGLHGKAKQDFMNMKIGDLISNPEDHLNKPFVRELSEEKNFELASGTLLFAHKPLQ